MELTGRERGTAVTQVSIGGFDRQVKAKDLVTFLEKNVGLVDRCRLKTSWTPPESYPDFKITDTAEVKRTNKYRKVKPHAFVHFTSAESAAEILDAASQCNLFWEKQLLKVSLGPQTPYFLNQRRRTTTPHKLSDVIVEIGTLVEPEKFLVAWRGPDQGVNFLVDPFDDMCRFCFNRDVAFSIEGTKKKAVIKCAFKVEFLVRDINEIRRYEDASYIVILLRLASSPLVWYRTADDDDIEEPVPIDLLDDDDDPWNRTTDFTPSGAIGRCSFYRISIPLKNGAKFIKAMSYLKGRKESPRWPIQIQNEPSYGMPMEDPFFCIQSQEGITFDIMFLLNAILHKGIFNQHNLSENFFGLLRNQPSEVNVATLKHLYSYKHPVFDAAETLKTVQEGLLRNPKLYHSSKRLDDVSEVRRLVVTPTKAYCLPPEVEISNRVLRKFKEVADRFLRVTFMDEGMQTINTNALNCYAAPILKKIKSNSFEQKTNIYRRVKSILEEGFKLCGRKYSFLAFSANQLRDCSAWFFAEEKNITCDDIRDWMGEFNIKNVAKYAARMGLCFSSTYATVEVAAHEEIPDIKRNGYDFSDGIGIVTPDLASEVAEKLKLDDVPSAYQIRYAGFKGVVACWPAKGDGPQLSLRSSMKKFKSPHSTLEICSWTRFQPGFLNRQIVTLLSALNVPDKVFWEMQEAMVSNLNEIFVHTDVAFDVLTRSCPGHGGSTAAIMLSVGFSPQSEPHLRGILTSVRAAQLWGLREKARIFVSSGRWLMGVLDELAVLEQGECFIQVSTPSLENCFSKHGSRFKEKKNLQVVEGFVVIAKNPCLHPGDVRVLKAVDVPGLHHLHDCLVFPQTGERPHTNEASGSDLDGDLYLVTWDENLIPPSKESSTPMDYSADECKLQKHKVTPRDLKNFFVKNMANENLGKICNAHVVHADRSNDGALDENCITLAKLAATAVDFPKTGKIVPMPSKLKPKLYPDFMGKEQHQSYKSEKIQGRLYRQIKDAYDEDLDPCGLKHEGHIPYDTDLEVLGSADFITDAWDQKCSYDGQLSGLLRQYKVETEEEVVTGQIWSLPKYTSRKLGDLQERLRHAYNALKKEFRQTFEKLNSDEEEMNDKDKHLLYEKKASAWYQVTYHPDWMKKTLHPQDKSQENRDFDSLGNKVKLSFPWIAVDYLARIKIRNRGIGNVDSTKPVDSLAKYLAERL